MEVRNDANIGIDSPTFGAKNTVAFVLAIILEFYPLICFIMKSCLSVFGPFPYFCASFITVVFAHTNRLLCVDK